MGRKLEWELSGKSDVPEKMAKAKASMEGLEGAANGLSKKFREAFKDIALGFIAPMVLVQQAISFISNSIEKARQDAKDAVEFAAGIKAEDLSKSPVDATTRYLAQKLQVDIRTEKEQEQAKKAKQVVVEEFLMRDPRGMEYYNKNAGLNMETGGPAISASNLAMLKRVQDDVFAMVQGDMNKALKDEQDKSAAAKAKETTAAAKGMEVGSNVVGVGMSPQLDALNRSVAIQEDMANSLRTLIERDQAESGFKTEKFFPSARRLPSR